MTAKFKGKRQNFHFGRQCPLCPSPATALSVGSYY